MFNKYLQMSSQELHNEAVNLSFELRKCETSLISVVGLINEKKSYLAFKCHSIYDYTEKFLQFKYQKTYDFISLFKASKNIPEIKAAISDSQIGYTKLRTIMPALVVKNLENKHKEVSALINIAKTTPRNKLEKIARDISPLEESNIPSPAPKYLGNNKIERVARLTIEQEIVLDKAINLLSGEFGEALSFEKFLDHVSKLIIENKLKKGNKKAHIFVDSNNVVVTKSLGELKINKSNLTPGEDFKINKTIPQKTKSIVLKRDGGKCKICGKSNNINFHHIKPKAENGNHDVSNIILVCNACHSLVHQGYIEIKGESGSIKINYKNKQITTFSDYLFNQKREDHLNNSYKHLKTKDYKKDKNLYFNF
jgi:hypothetical protein